MLTTLEKQEFVLTDKQAQAIDLISSDAMHILLYGGSRSTKTFTFVRSTVIRAFIFQFIKTSYKLNLARFM